MRRGMRHIYIYIYIYIRHRAARHQWSVSNALYHVPWFLSSFKGTQGGLTRASAWPFSDHIFTSVFACVLGRYWWRFWVPFGSKLDPNSTRHRWKINSERSFENKATISTHWSRKSMLSNMKNIVKMMEGCSKSHFSHIRKDVHKMTLRPSFWRGFSSQNRPKIEKKSFWYRYGNRFDLSLIFLSDF